MLASTGLRVGKLQGLTWDDIELDPDGQGGLWHVRAKPGEWRPKDKENRHIPLLARVAKVLVGLPRNHRFVFTAVASKQYPEGAAPISARRLLVSSKRTLKKLGIVKGTLHAFRRFFISFCANNGVEAFKLMEWVGRSDLKMALRYHCLGEAESCGSLARAPFGGIGDKKDDES